MVSLMAFSVVQFSCTSIQQNCLTQPYPSSQRSDTGDGERDANGRLFKSYPSAYLRLIFERLGFSLINEWGNSDAMTRQGIEWVSLLFQLKSEANTRPIDQIEGVLNHDKKTATYKFA
jgi:hypothetical protein